MTNVVKYDKVFTELFEIGADKLNEQLAIRTFSKWDSISHLSLITKIEDAFDIMLDAEDILEFRSYAIGKDILRKYGIVVV